MNEPTSAIATETSVPVPATHRRRTVLIWVVLGWALWSVIGLIGMWMPLFKPTPDVELQRAADMLGLDVALMRPNLGLVLIATFNIAVLCAGAWAMFMLRASCVRMFQLSFVVAMLASVYGLIAIPNYTALLSSPAGLGGLVFSLVFYATLLWYAMRLRRQGVLQ